MSLRIAGPADVVEVRDLVLATFVGYLPRLDRQPAPMNADYSALVDAGQVWLAVDGGVLAGVVVLVPGDEELLVETVAVRPAKQGQGVGFRLMALAEAQARRRGLPAVTLYTNLAMTENLLYYPRLGYHETCRGEHHGFQRVFFRKTLGSEDDSTP